MLFQILNNEETSLSQIPAPFKVLSRETKRLDSGVNWDAEP